MGFDIRIVDSLTLPSGGWSIAVHWKQRQEPHEHGLRYTDRTYSNNQDPKKKTSELATFKDYMDTVDRNLENEATFTIAAPTDGADPTCCLFSEPSFGGNVWCMRVGGEDILPQWNKKAQSVSCRNGAQVWLYAKIRRSWRCEREGQRAGSEG